MTAAEREIARNARVKVIFTLVLFVGVSFYYGWYSQPHPHVRTTVQFRDVQVVTVEGVSEGGWLTECDTGLIRHIVGDYSLTKTELPVVCSNERHYEEWLQGIARQNGAQ